MYIIYCTKSYTKCRCIGPVYNYLTHHTTYRFIVSDASTPAAAMSMLINCSSLLYKKSQFTFLFAFHTTYLEALEALAVFPPKLAQLSHVLLLAQRVHTQRMGSYICAKVSTTHTKKDQRTDCARLRIVIAGHEDALRHELLADTRLHVVFSQCAYKRTNAHLLGRLARLHVVVGLEEKVLIAEGGVPGPWRVACA